MTQGQQASFTCEAVGFGNFGIKWEVDGMLYDKGVCDNNIENCTIAIPNEHTSTLKLNADYIKPNTTLTIVCVVNQSLPDIESNDTTEVILPIITSRTRRSETVQLEIEPLYNPTTPSTGPMATPSGDSQGMYECGN